MPRARAIGLLLVALSAVALVISLPAMARQIRAHNADRDLPFYGMRSPRPDAIPFVDGKAAFTWGVGAGEAAVNVTLDDANNRLLVEYRGETGSVPITGVVDERLPGFARFRDNQIRLVVLSEERPARKADGELTSEPASPDRLVLAARIEREVREGEDPSEMAGIVDRKAWRYQILEFTPVGVEPPDGRMIRTHEFTYADLPEMERTWQYAAALNVTPALKLPKLKDPMGSNRGLDGVGWPFPAAATALLVGVVGVAMVGGSFVGRKPRTTAGKPTGVTGPDA